MSRDLKTFLLLFFSLLLPGCGNLAYLSKLGWHQSFITFQSVPVQEVLKNEGLEEKEKQKIQLVQEVKRYGEKRIGLKRTGNYTKYFEVRKPVLYVITACEKDRLQLYHWNFPIIGQVTYKSFFTLEEALREKEALESNGYDTYLQPVAAYSTLGWLKDPIFSTMLGWDEPTLVNIILHEMVHATIYFKGESDLNEQLATFIGDRGTLLFLTEKYGPESKEVALAMAYQEDDLRFAKWIEEAYAQLMRFYEQPLLREEKLRMREEVFQMIQEKFREMESQLKTDCYRNFGRRKFNNAVLMAHRRYLGRLDRWESLYETMGRDLRKAVEFLKEIKASGDKKALISFLE